MEDSKKIRGGEFLIKATETKDIFIPEEWNEEQKMMSDMCTDFLEKEILPNLDRIDKMEEGLMSSLIEKSGELGLLSISIPEEYGGFSKDFNTSLLITEKLGSGHSFTVAFAAHTGIGTLPILYFGNDKQKKKYLPKLASGEWKASYCLTEPGSGSDALAAKTKAILSKNKKHYILNGQKMWITNAGFADVFIVFAQVDGDKFTGFIVEKGFKGLSLGNEEHKMGIKGSSTRQVFLQDCKVPVENVLGEIGKGHEIAFNILNIGRIKLAGAALGSAKYASDLSIQYTNERKQFKLPISKFGAIQNKLADQAIQIYTLESAMYRTGFDVENEEKSLLDSGQDFASSLLGAAKEYSVEAAVLKVAGSEMLDFVADEGVQIYGGYGFSADYPMDRIYRDSRINRIFEGTNEINRLLITGMLLKKAMKGELDLMSHAKTVQAELMAIPDFSSGEEETTFSEEEKAIENMRKSILMVAGFAAQKYMAKIEREQEIMMNIADMIIKLYLSESVLLRTKKFIEINGDEKSQNHIDMCKCSVRDALDKVNLSGKLTIEAMCIGDEYRMLMLGLKRFSKIGLFNRTEAKRNIAKALISENKYIF